MKRTVLGFALAALTFVAAACGKDESGGGGGGGSGTGGGGGSASSGPDLSTPQGAFKALDEAFRSMDIAKFEAIYSAEAMKEGKERMQKELDEMKKEFASVSFTWNDADIKVEGDTASVKGKLIFKKKDGTEEDDGETMRLVKEGGKWKVSK